LTEGDLDDLARRMQSTSNRTPSVDVGALKIQSANLAEEISELNDQINKIEANIQSEAYADPALTNDKARKFRADSLIMANERWISTHAKIRELKSQKQRVDIQAEEQIRQDRVSESFFRLLCDEARLLASGFHLRAALTEFNTAKLVQQR